jgi:hypothetical protein
MLAFRSVLLSVQPLDSSVRAEESSDNLEYPVGVVVALADEKGHFARHGGVQHAIDDHIHGC